MQDSSNLLCLAFAVLFFQFSVLTESVDYDHIKASKLSKKNKSISRIQINGFTDSFALCSHPLLLSLIVHIQSSIINNFRSQ